MAGILVGYARVSTYDQQAGPMPNTATSRLPGVRKSSRSKFPPWPNETGSRNAYGSSAGGYPGSLQAGQAGQKHHRPPARCGRPGPPWRRHTPIRRPSPSKAMLNLGPGHVLHRSSQLGEVHQYRGPPVCTCGPRETAIACKQQRPYRGDPLQSHRESTALVHIMKITLSHPGAMQSRGFRCRRQFFLLPGAFAGRVALHGRRHVIGRRNGLTTICIVGLIDVTYEQRNEHPAVLCALLPGRPHGRRCGQLNSAPQPHGLHVRRLSRRAQRLGARLPQHERRGVRQSEHLGRH
jgi:hypothetical protein